MARTTFVSMVAVGLLAAVISSNIRAFATDDCLAEPNRQPARANIGITAPTPRITASVGTFVNRRGLQTMT
jgi:hypothetical protein